MDRPGPGIGDLQREGQVFLCWNPRTCPEGEVDLGGFGGRAADLRVMLEGPCRRAYVEYTSKTTGVGWPRPMMTEDETRKGTPSLAAPGQWKAISKGKQKHGDIKNISTKGRINPRCEKMT